MPSFCRKTQQVTGTFGLSMRDSFRSGCGHARSSPEPSPHSSKPSGDHCNIVAALPVAFPTSVDFRPGSRQTMTSPSADAADRTSPLAVNDSFVRTSASDLRTRTGSTGISAPGDRRNRNRITAVATMNTAAPKTRIVFCSLPDLYTKSLLLWFCQNGPGSEQQVSRSGTSYGTELSPSHTSPPIRTALARRFLQNQEFARYAVPFGGCFDGSRPHPHRDQSVSAAGAPSLCFQFDQRFITQRNGEFPCRLEQAQRGSSTESSGLPERRLFQPASCTSPNISHSNHKEHPPCRTFPKFRRSNLKARTAEILWPTNITTLPKRSAESRWKSCCGSASATGTRSEATAWTRSVLRRCSVRGKTEPTRAGRRGF